MDTTSYVFEGLRGVGRVELTLPKKEAGAYVFFGGNGVGKSKTLEALHQGLLFSSSAFRSPASGVHSGEFGTIRTKSLACKVMRVNGHEMFLASPGIEVQAGDDNWVYPWTHTTWVAHQKPVVFVGAASRGGFSRGQGALAVPAIGSFADRQVRYFSAVLERMSGDGGGDLTNAFESWVIQILSTHNEYLAVEDRRIAELNSTLGILHTLDERFPADPSPDNLRYDGNNRVSVRVQGEMRRLGEISSGFAALMQVVQGIVNGYGCFTNVSDDLCDVAGCVLIDEIDMHLHGEWQVKIVPTLKRLFPKTTFFIATHSPLVVSQLEDDEAFLLKRDSDDVVRAKPVRSASKKLFADMVQDAFGVDLDQLKLDRLLVEDQSAIKRDLRALRGGLT